jgi:hypothetical protein
VVVRETRAREQARLARLAETVPFVTRGARAVSIALDHGRVDRVLLDPSVAPAAGERLLQKALATSAAVTVAPTPAGAAALLRW